MVAEFTMRLLNNVEINFQYEGASLRIKQYILKERRYGFVLEKPRVNLYQLRGFFDGNFTPFNCSFAKASFLGKRVLLPYLLSDESIATIGILLLFNSSIFFNTPVKF